MEAPISIRSSASQHVGQSARICSSSERKHNIVVHYFLTWQTEAKLTHVTWRLECHFLLFHKRSCSRRSTSGFGARWQVRWGGGRCARQRVNGWWRRCSTHGNGGGNTWKTKCWMHVHTMSYIHIQKYPSTYNHTC